MEEIKEIALKIVNDLENNTVPAIRIPKRSKDNIIFDKTLGYLKLGDKFIERRLNDVAEVRRFTQTLTILKILKEINEQDIYMNTRGIYYCQDNIQLPNKKYLFEEQKESDAILVDVEAMLGKVIEELHITSNSKGHVVGDVKFKSYTKTREYVIDCRNVGPEGARIPRDLSRLEVIECNANFVLVIEKDTICFTLNYEEFWEKYNCILVTAEGMPDRATRAFIRELNMKFKKPVAYLGDNDPYGWYIYGVYKNGSIRLAHEVARLATPDIKFVGLTASDIINYKFPPKTLEAATERDLKRAEELKKYEWFSDDFWQRELDLFLKIKVKSKIDALAAYGYRFLQERYLPERLHELGLI